VVVDVVELVDEELVDGTATDRTWLIGEIVVVVTSDN
jgi:hypothetical protein